MNRVYFEDMSSVSIQTIQKWSQPWIQSSRFVSAPWDSTSTPEPASTSNMRSPGPVSEQHHLIHIVYLSRQRHGYSMGSQMTPTVTDTQPIHESMWMTPGWRLRASTSSLTLFSWCQILLSTCPQSEEVIQLLHFSHNSNLESPDYYFFTLYSSKVHSLAARLHCKCLHCKHLQCHIYTTPVATHMHVCKVHFHSNDFTAHTPEIACDCGSASSRHHRSAAQG